MKISRPVRAVLLATLGLASILLLGAGVQASNPTLAHWLSPAWTADQKYTLKSLWLGSLPPLPADPSNPYADDTHAAEFGQALFFDNRFSINGKVSCATCHQPDRLFTDGLPVGIGLGSTTRNTPTILGVAYSSWFFLDGRADSQWSQALGPMESAVEHGGTRTLYAHLIAQYYRDEYQSIFGALPDLSDPARYPPSAGPVDDPEVRAAWEAMPPVDQVAVSRVYANMGKALAAYERQLMPGPSRFDAYVAALLQDDFVARLRALTPDEVAGLELFIGEGQCIQCHNGPLLTNNEFHNLGVPPVPGAPIDDGRKSGVLKVLASEFNCLGAFSDAGKKDCAALRFVKTTGHELDRAFRTPTLRNVSQTGPYMHDGQMSSLYVVLDFYNRAPAPDVGHSELVPLNLSDQQLKQLEAFLLALEGGMTAPPELLAPPDP